MILDAKQRGVKTVTSQAQRVTLPQLFDAILQILCLLTFVAAGVNEACGAVEAFVLDFPDDYWQMPIHKSEQQQLCATGHQRRAKAVRCLESCTRQLGGWHSMEPTCCRGDASHSITV